MAVPQQKFRELVFQLLYSDDVAACEPAVMVKFIMKEQSVPRSAVKQAQERVAAILVVKDTLDARIDAVSETYDFSRIQVVERNILRLGLYEIEHDDAIPPKVAITEAVRLTRKFGTPEGATFINALLDALWKKEDTHSVVEAALAKEASEASEEAAKNVVESCEREDDEGEDENF